MKVLKIVAHLFDTFHSNDIKYVHWKSNINLNKALGGDDDLDILVSPQDELKLIPIFKELNVIRGYSEGDSWQEGVVHYYTLDEQTASIVHIHLHFQLPVGYDYNKNFVLPVVEQVLANRVLLHNVYVSSPEHEYILLVLRILIKNALTPFLLSAPPTQIRLIRTSNIVVGRAYEEFLHLKAIVDEHKLQESLKNDFNFIDILLFRKCETVIDENNSLKEYFKISHKLKKSLDSFRDRNELSSFIISFNRINKNRLRKLKKKFFSDSIKGTKLPENGGRIFAFVGGDGAGKSTNIEILKKKLSKNFKTTSIHIGKPSKNALGIVLYNSSRVFRVVGLNNLGGLLVNMQLAIDRKRAFLRADNLRKKGIIVILDRIPLNGITAMDCPRIDTNRFPRFAKWERKKYKHINGVDLLFVMKLNPEIALQRRPNDDPDNLRIRSGQIWNGVWEYPYQIVIDTGEMDFHEVEQRILIQTWSSVTKPFKRVELLGISGTGKTVISKRTERLYSNVSQNLSLNESPWLALKAALKYPKGAFYVAISSKKIPLSRINFRIEYYSTLISMHLAKYNEFNTHLILDQSILYTYIFAFKEGYIQEEMLVSEINKISDFFDFVFLLEGTKELLYDRVVARKSQGIGRAKDMSFSDFSDFYDEYYSAFELLKKTNLNLVRIDSSQLNPTEIAHRIINQS